MELLTLVNQLKKLEKKTVSLYDWVHEHRQLRMGGQYKPFSLDGHEYMREWLLDPQPDTVFEKGAQMGVSEHAVSWALWLADSHEPVTVIYFFPNDGDVADFSNTRVRPVIERCDHLLNQVADINNVHLRQLGSSLVYFRGMFSKAATKSVPADAVIFDELDESNPTNKAQAMERMSHSPFKYRMELSTPTLPDYGIDIEFQRSDQRYWHVDCGCSAGIILEDVFPNCMAVRNEGTDEEEVFYYCPKCGKERLDVCVPKVIKEYTGWVPKLPENKHIRGYHTSQLFSKAIPAQRIWTEYKNTRNMPEFYNSKLGMPYAGDRMPLTADMMRECCGNYGLARTGKNVFIGIDQGDELHIIVIKPDVNTGQRKVIFAACLEDNDCWEQAIRICKGYENPVIVIDAMPEKHLARKLVDEFPGVAFMNYYNDNQKDAIVKDFDDKDPDKGRKITTHRTEMLDRMVDGFNFTVQGRLDGIVLPNAQLPIVQKIIAHCTAIAKLKQTKTIKVNGGNQETGEVSYVYVHVRPDHFAHALNYACVAEALEVWQGYAGMW